MDLLTVKEAADKWGIGARMVSVYCENDRIPGAFKKGNLWLIPGDAEKPVDRRTRVEKAKIKAGTTLRKQA